MSWGANNGIVRQIGRFSLAGVINTIVGYAVIFGGLALGFSPYGSNLAGYSTGLLCSFILSKTFVFSAPGRKWRQTRRFLITFAIAYLANLALLHGSLRIGIGGIAAQILSGVLYLLVMFILSRSWVFK
uniref:Flippase GtrA (Transmembrane translocase of bactoprenol-linked glucose) n=1 Tax=Candidatus Kentrum sp. FW TaxID=2126338 RepID=A0A450TCC4_9GAMM|nr:MAG: Putative flippase GtrA (transmembrane translocase of bactoprenol-linked glucose) [Candidatus Kentron sp. FW]